MIGDTLLIIQQVLAVLLLWNVGLMLVRDVRSRRAAKAERRGHAAGR